MSPAGAAPGHATPGGPVLVFVHGTRLNAAAWNGQVRRLRDAAACVTFDLPGHGARAAEPFTLEAAARSVAEAARSARSARSGGPVILVGNSLGGYVAIETAARYPDLVDGLVLAGCSADPVGPTGLLFRLYATVLERLPVQLLDTAMATWLRVRYGRAVADPIVARGFGTTGGAAAIRSLVGRRFSDRLFGLWVPTLLINGALDPVFGPGGDHWAATARRGRHVVLRRATHFGDMDRPGAFAAAVRRFTAELSRDV